MRNLFVLLLLLLPTKVFAVEASKIIGSLDNENVEVYLRGVADMASMMNAIAGMKKDEIICYPNNLSISIDIIKQALRVGYDKMGDQEAVGVILLGLMEIFPCNQ